LRGLTPRQPAAEQGGIPLGKCGLRATTASASFEFLTGGFLMSEN